MKILLRRGRQVAALKNRGRFLNLLRKAGELTGFACDRPGILQFVLLNPEEMTALNALHLGHQGVTDVITYDLRETGSWFPADEETVLAEIYLCPEVARRNAGRFGQPPSREQLLYAVHGLLHLQGEYDLTEAGRISMRAAEKRILAALEPGSQDLTFF